MGLSPKNRIIFRRKLNIKLANYDTLGDTSTCTTYTQKIYTSRHIGYRELDVCIAALKHATLDFLSFQGMYFQLKILFQRLFKAHLQPFFRRIWR